MRIRAAVVWEVGGAFEIEEIDLEEPRDDEVLVRLVSSGVCRTDLEARERRLPIPPPPSVFGHEGSGVVERIGKRVNKVRPGDHVVLGWSSCGHCASCRSGNESYCADFIPQNFGCTRSDGTTTLRRGEQIIHSSFFGQSSFASHATVNERNVVKIRKDVPLDLVGPMGCGIRTGAGAVLNALRPGAGSSIAIFGAGSVGMSAVLAAVLSGCASIVVVDINAARLEMSKSFGATHIIDSGKTDPVEGIREITGGGADYALECTGVPKVLRQAVDSLLIGGPRCGVCGLLGSVPPGTEVTLDMQAILNGRTVRGILAGDSVSDLFIPALIELYLQGRFPIDRMIRHYPFEAISEAVEDMEKGTVLKPVLRF